MILSRFFKPKWQHPDPQVRKLAVQSLSHSDPALAQVAKEDQNPGVRRTALYRINNLELLQQIASEDSEVGVRETADAHFRKLMTGKESDSPSLQLRLTIFEQTPSPGLAEFLALNAAEPELRLVAVLHIENESILGDIAVKDSAANVRLAALERVGEASTLSYIAKSTLHRDKRVNRGARERLEALRIDQERKRHSEQLCAEMESIAQDQPTKANIGRFRTLENAWEKQKHLASPDLVERFQGPKAQFLEHIRESEAQRREKIELCRSLKHFSKRLQTETELLPALATEIQATLQEICQKWDQLKATDSAEEMQFTHYLKTINDHERVLHRNHERAERLREVLREADELLHQSSEVRDEDLKKLQKRWGSLERPETPSQAADLQQQFDAALSRLRARLRRQIEQRDQELAEIRNLIDNLELALTEGALQQAISLRDLARQRLKQNISLSRGEMASLQKKLHASFPRINELRGWRRWGTGQAREHLCEEAESLIGVDEDPVFIAQQIKQLRAAWKSLDGLEEAASKTLWEKFNSACEHAYEPCQAYFDAQTQQRQTNLEKKEAICERLEAFESATDWESADWRTADRTRREAHNQWRKIGPVNRTVRKDLEKRYRKILRRLDTHLDKERQRDLQRRKALIHRVQELADSEDLRTAMAEAKKAQAEWQPTVLSSRREEQALWREFRVACDAIFQRREVEQQAADAERQANLARKTTLCDEIEALLTGGDDETLTQARIKIQETMREWSTVGPVPKAAQQAIELRFSAAREKLEQRLREQQRAREREALHGLRNKAELCSRIEALLFREQPADTQSALKQAKEAWEAMPPLKPQLETSLRQRFESACHAVAEDGVARQSLIKALEENLESKKILCLRMEIIAGVETPPEFAQARMEYQVSRLSESLTTRNTGTSERNIQDEARRIEQEWYLTGSAPAELNDFLTARFNRAVAVFHKESDKPKTMESSPD